MVPIHFEDWAKTRGGTARKAFITLRNVRCDKGVTLLIGGLLRHVMAVRMYPKCIHRTIQYFYEVICTDQRPNTCRHFVQTCSSCSSAWDLCVGSIVARRMSTSFLTSMSSVSDCIGWNPEGLEDLTTVLWRQSTTKPLTTNKNHVSKPRNGGARFIQQEETPSVATGVLRNFLWV